MTGKNEQKRQGKPPGRHSISTTNTCAFRTATRTKWRITTGRKQPQCAFVHCILKTIWTIRSRTCDSPGEEGKIALCTHVLKNIQW